MKTKPPEKGRCVIGPDGDLHRKIDATAPGGEARGNIEQRTSIGNVGGKGERLPAAGTDVVGNDTAGAGVDVDVIVAVLRDAVGQATTQR